MSYLLRINRSYYNKENFKFTFHFSVSSGRMTPFSRYFCPFFYFYATNFLTELRHGGAAYQPVVELSTWNSTLRNC